MNITATTNTLAPAGVPRTLGCTWADSWLTESESIAHALAEEAYARVIEPMISMAQRHIDDELRAIIREYVPQPDRTRGSALLTLASNLGNDEIIATMRLITAIVTATCGTFDPLLTMEENLQRALAAIGITSEAEAIIWATGQAPQTLTTFAEHFPDITLGPDGDAAKGGAA